MKKLQKKYLYITGMFTIIFIKLVSYFFQGLGNLFYLILSKLSLIKTHLLLADLTNFSRKYLDSVKSREGLVTWSIFLCKLFQFPFMTDFP